MVHQHQDPKAKISRKSCECSGRRRVYAAPAIKLSRVHTTVRGGGSTYLEMNKTDRRNTPV